MIKNSLKILLYCVIINIVVSTKTFAMARSATLPDDRTSIESIFNQLAVGFAHGDPLSKLEQLFNALPDSNTQKLVKKKLVQKYLFQLALAEPLFFESTKIMIKTT